MSSSWRASNLIWSLWYAAGSINISNILTGKCLAKIRASNCFPAEKDCTCSSDFDCSSCHSKKRAIHSSRIRSTVAEALEDITALFYDEERSEIYTGNRHGLVHVWSNWWFLLFSLFFLSFLLFYGFVLLNGSIDCAAQCMNILNCIINQIHTLVPFCFFSSYLYHLLSSLMIQTMFMLFINLSHMI